MQTMRLIPLLLFLFLSACTSVPEGITPVKSFDKSRYLGTWYEIARLDHSFERGLEQISATYTLREDGGIDVLNRGFHVDDGRWNEAIGKAYFVDSEDVGHLKVSFFGPFYASYVIMALDPDYQWALVTGPNRDYFWILSRTPSLPETTLKMLLEQARNKRFSVQDLIYVQHD